MRKSKKIQKNEEIIKQQQEIINERKLDYIYDTLQELIHYKDEETIPYLLKKYENNIDELEKYVDDVGYKLIDLHKLTFEYEDFTLINLNNIGCVTESFFDNRHNYEDYKDLTFIGFVTYIHMSYESGMISKNELTALLNDLFDCDWADVTNGLYME